MSEGPLIAVLGKPIKGAALALIRVTSTYLLIDTPLLFK